MRKLSVRERVLLFFLAVIAGISGYILFFHIPTSQQTEQLAAQIDQMNVLKTQLEQKQEKQWMMQIYLDRLEKEQDALPKMPQYDNVKAVMAELNGILESCEEYTLSFYEGEAEEHIFIRGVTIPFICSNYNNAKSILQQLHDSTLRGMLKDVDLSVQEDGRVRVTAVMEFYEYSDKQP